MSRIYRTMCINSAGLWTELSVSANSEEDAASKLRKAAEAWEACRLRFAAAVDNSRPKERAP